MKRTHKHDHISFLSQLQQCGASSGNKELTIMCSLNSLLARRVSVLVLGGIVRGDVLTFVSFFLVLTSLVNPD